MNTPPKILLIEDDLFLREIYGDGLKHAGFAVTVAEEGFEGLWKIRHGEWDLILLDIFLPNITGIEIINKLKKSNKEDLLRQIVFLSNSDNEEDLKAIEESHLTYLLKSTITPDKIGEEVKKLLEKKES